VALRFDLRNYLGRSIRQLVYLESRSSDDER